MKGGKRPSMQFFEKKNNKHHGSNTIQRNYGFNIDYTLFVTCSNTTANMLVRVRKNRERGGANQIGPNMAVAHMFRVNWAQLTQSSTFYLPLFLYFRRLNFKMISDNTFLL